MAAKRDPRLDRFGLEGYNKFKRTPDHPTKWGVVLAKEGNKTRLIRFGDQKSTTAGKPSSNDTPAEKARRKAFFDRHAKNIAKGKLSAAFWAAKARW